MEPAPIPAMRIIPLLGALALVFPPIAARAAEAAAATQPNAATAAGSAASADDNDTREPTAAAPKEDPAAQPYWQGLKLLRTGNNADWKRARDLLDESAALEFTHAQNFIGSSMLNGAYGYPKNAKKAATLFELAAARGNGFAALNLGLCYFNGAGVRKDKEKAAQWLGVALGEKADYYVPPPPQDFYSSPAADGSDSTLSGEIPVDPADTARATAHFVLAQVLAASNKLPEAQEHYVKAATAGPAGRAGIYQAAINAATGYAFGRGVPRDLTKANEMLDQSKKLGRRIGTVYAHSLVANKALDDFAQADIEQQFSDSTEKAEQQIQFDIAGTFADPKSKDYNPAEAAKWYELAADSGQPWPMLSLAFLHAQGKLGAPNPEKAFEYFKMAAEKGHHTLGHANVGICYANGIGTAKDEAKANEIFQKYRDDDIVCYLGTIGQAPKSIVTYEEQLELNKSWAKNKDAQANYLLGKRYLNGWGVRQDMKEAADYMTRAAKANHAAAQSALGVMYQMYGVMLFSASPEGAAKSAAAWYQKSADNNYVPAIANLASCFSVGRGVPMDLNKTIALYERCIALDPKFAPAHNDLGTIYEARFHATRNSSAEGENRDKMMKCYLAAAELGNSYAYNNLGRIMHDGLTGKPDFEKAYDWYTRAAEAGHADARRMLGRMHERGEGVPVTYREAAYHYRLAALAGDRQALVSLCDFYLAGKGVSRDFDRAAYWLLMLAQAGDVRGIIGLGDLALKRKDYDNALTLFRQLSETSNRVMQGYAYERMSWMYERGWGVKANPSKAKRYHELAFDLDDNEAIFRTALRLIQSGKLPEGRALLEKSANGVAAAQYSLGVMCINGDGGAKDPVRGLKLIHASAKRGHPDAQVAAAAATLKQLPNAPALDEAIQFAEGAEAVGRPNAKAIREQLEAMKK